MLYIMNILSLSQRKEYLKITFLEQIKTIKDVFFLCYVLSVFAIYMAGGIVSPFLLIQNPRLKSGGTPLYSWFN